MNKVEWIDKAFRLADLTLDDYLMLKGLEGTTPRKVALCSAAEAMTYLSLSKGVFYDLKNKGLIPYVANLGQKDRYSYKALDEVIKLNTARGIISWDTSTQGITTTTPTPV